MSAAKLSTRLLDLADIADETGWTLGGRMLRALALEVGQLEQCQQDYVRATGKAWPGCTLCQGSGVTTEDDVAQPCIRCLEGVR